MPDLDRKIFLTEDLWPLLEECPAGLVYRRGEDTPLLNAQARRILTDQLGIGETGLSHWTAAALTRLQAAGRDIEILEGKPDGAPLEIRWNPGPNGGNWLSVAEVPDGHSGGDLAETVSTLSHELRTPLTSIKSALKLVHSQEAGELNQDQSHFLGMALRNIERLDRLVSDLLDVSRADAGQLNIHHEQIDLVALTAQLVADNQELARSRGLDLSHRSGARSLEGNLDPDKVVQMVSNLLGNALKFTPTGGQVQLRLEKGVTAGRKEALIEVRDDGPGMDAQTLAMALQPFHRDKRADEQNVPGSGLGLHITRGLAQAHGGIMGLDSRLGQGTIAWIRLPLDGSPLDVSEPPGDQAGIRI